MIQVPSRDSVCFTDGTSDWIFSVSTLQGFNNANDVYFMRLEQVYITVVSTNYKKNNPKLMSILGSVQKLMKN